MNVKYSILILTVLLCVCMALPCPVYADTVHDAIDNSSGTVDFDLSGQRGSAMRTYVVFDKPENSTGYLNIDFRGYIPGNQYYQTYYHWVPVFGMYPTFANTKSYSFTSYVNFTYPINPYKGDYATVHFVYLNFTTVSSSDITFQISDDGKTWKNYNSGLTNTTTVTHPPNYTVDFHYTAGDAYDYDISVSSINGVLKIRDLPTTTRYIRFVCKFTMYYPISHQWLDDVSMDDTYNVLTLPYQDNGLTYYRDYETANTANIINIGNNISDINSNIAILSNNINSGNASIVSSIESSTSEQTGTITDAMIQISEGISSDIETQTTVIVDALTNLDPEMQEFFDSKINEIEDFTVVYDQADDELQSAADSAVSDVENFDMPDEFDEFLDDDSWTLFGSIPFDIELVGLFLSTLVAIAIVSYIITGKNR